MKPLWMNNKSKLNNKVRRYEGMNQLICRLHGKEFSDLSFVV